LQLSALTCNVHSHWQTGGHLPTEHGRGAGKDVYMLRRVVKYFRGRSMCVGMSNVSTTYGLSGQAATTRTVAIIRLHFAAPSLPCTCLPPPAGFGCMSPLVAACGALRACSLFPENHTATAVLFGVQSAESCFAGQLVDRRPAVFYSGLPTAMSIIDY